MIMMVNRNFHSAYLYDRTTRKRIKGYLQNIAMTPIKFHFKAGLKSPKAQDLVSTDVMTYKVLVVKKYSPSVNEAILVNKNLI